MSQAAEPATSESFDRATLLNSLPPPWPDDLLPEIQRRVQADGRKVVVLDDDPTGTQTVYGVPVLTTWDVEALRAELLNALPACYLLTNTRSMPLQQARALNTEIGHNLAAAAQQTGRGYTVVSRSDSTLRGHFPGETDALADALGGCDATILVPAFIAGGRYTINDVHYVTENDRLVPAGQTPFARDASFGYRASNLRAWVAEKTGGRVTPEAVRAITLEDIRRGGPERVEARLRELSDGCVCIVNAADDRDLAVATLGILRAEAAGKRFLMRTAASFVAWRAGLAPRPLLAAADLDLPATGGGLIIVGSYVPASSQQLGALLAHGDVAHIEIAVEAVLDNSHDAALAADTARAIDALLRANRDVILSTSRTLVASADAEGSLAIGQRVSAHLVAVTQALAVRPRYILAKGGITSSDIATQGLQVRRALVLGQILTGVPVWRLGAESAYPGLAYIVFPGNVGGPDALNEVVGALRATSAT